MAGDAESQVVSEPGISIKRGGWITFPFMMGTLLGLVVASWGWLLNLIVFLTEEFNVKNIAAAQISNIVLGCISMFPVIGAIIADSFFGTFSVISVSALISLVGIVILTLTASFDSLRPQACGTASTLCGSPNNLQLGVLYTAIALASIGSGGTRFSLATAGANQFDKPKDQESYFNWFFFVTYFASVISATVIVYAEDNAGWKVGFGLCVASSLVALVIFLLGKRFYRHDKPQGSPFTSLARVMVAAVRKRKAAISSNEEDYHHELKLADRTGNEIPTKSFRFLNRAALKNEGDIKPDGSIGNPWKLCSVQQVEDFKAIIRIVPLLLATIFLSAPIAIQLSLIVLQALAMDRSLGPHFKIPAGSMQVITLISTCLFLMLTDRFIYPLYQKVTGKPLMPLQKVGIGHLFNILSMAVSAIVESKRLNTRQAGSVVPMPVLWLVPQLVIVGIGEAFHFPGNVGLCYQEFPASLKNTATSMTSLVIGICFYLSTAIINLIHKTTHWLPDDINHGRVDNVYWVLVIGGVMNLGYFLVCAWLYKYRNLEEVGANDSSVSNNKS